MTLTGTTPAPPLPRQRGLAAVFYDLLRGGALHIQQCAACRAWAFPPREACTVCGTPDLEWVPSTGVGHVFTFTVVHRSLHPALPDVPFIVAVVELEEGPRLMTRLVDADPAEVRIGDHVELAPTAVVEAGVVLPWFRPASRDRR